MTQPTVYGYLRPSLYLGRRGAYWKAARHHETNLLQLLLVDASGMPTQPMIEALEEPCADTPLAITNSASSGQGREPCHNIQDQNCRDGFGTCSSIDGGESMPDSGEEPDGLLSDEEFINRSPLPILRWYREVEVTWPDRMLDYITDHSDNVADITHLRLCLTWIPGQKLGYKGYFYKEAWIEEAEAMELKDQGRWVKTFDMTKPASTKEVTHVLLQWIEMLERLSELTINLRHLEVCWYGHEYSTDFSFVQALARLQVAEQAVLYGSYDKNWLPNLAAEFGVPVLKGAGSVLIPTGHPLGMLHYDSAEESSDGSYV